MVFVHLVVLCFLEFASLVFRDRFSNFLSNNNNKNKIVIPTTLSTGTLKFFPICFDPFVSGFGAVLVSEELDSGSSISSLLSIPPGNLTNIVRVSESRIIKLIIEL